MVGHELVAAPATEKTKVTSEESHRTDNVSKKNDNLENKEKQLTNEKSKLKTQVNEKQTTDDEWTDESSSFDNDKFYIHEELIKLNKMHQEHTDTVVNHYSQLLKQSTDLFNLSKEQYIPRPVYIPRESGILPVKKPQATEEVPQKQQPRLPPAKTRPLLMSRGQSSGDLIPRPQAGPLAPSPTGTKRTELQLEHLGPQKRRVQEGNSFEISQKSPDGTVQPYSTVSSKHYVDLKNTARNIQPLSNRSSFITRFSPSYIKGGEDIETISTDQAQLPSSTVYKQLAAMVIVIMKMIFQ